MYSSTGRKNGTFGCNPGKGRSYPFKLELWISTDPLSLPSWSHWFWWRCKSKMRRIGFFMWLSWKLTPDIRHIDYWFSAITFRIRWTRMMRVYGSFHSKWCALLLLLRISNPGELLQKRTGSIFMRKGHRDMPEKLLETFRRWILELRCAILNEKSNPPAMLGRMK